MKRKLFSLLVLLVAAVSGAWADAVPTYNLSVVTNDYGTVKFLVNGNEVTKADEGQTVTLKITPNTDFILDQAEGQWIAVMAKAPRRVQSNIDVLNGVELTPVVGQENTFTFEMKRADAEFSVTYKKKITHADISITAPNQVFNGQDLQPVVTVKDGSTTLVKNKDYTLNIPECINVGEYAVVVTGKGFYTGMTSVTYKVTGRPINTLMISEVKPLTYTGKQHRPLVTVSFGETTLVKDQDYYLGYTNNINAGTAKMSIMGLGNYTGYAFLEFDITKAPLTVKADDAMVISGKQPSFTASYEGFVNNQTEAVLEGELAFACEYTPESAVGSTFAITPSGLTAKNYDITFVPGTLTVAEDTEATAALIAAREALQTVIGIATNVSPEGLADAIAAARAALTDESATAESLAQATQTLEAAIKAYFGEVLPRLGAIVQGLNDETLNAAYADAQTTLAKEGVTLQELIAATQNIITAAKAVAPEHLQNLKAYAVKYGAEDAAILVDNALAAIEAGNVSQIIATMAAVNEAATPLAQQVLSGIIGYVQAFGLTEQATQAQAALESGNYITMITTAKALFTHLVAAAKEYLPKLGAIVEGLNDETLNAAYADAQALLAKESITPEELGAAMQNIITAAKAVAPEHLQNLRGYAVKYGAADAVDKVDAALAAIEAGNVAQMIATMTAVKEAATPLAQQVLSGIIGYVQAFGLTEQATQAQAALESGNYITMITTAKALFTHLVAAAKEYLPKLGAIVEGLNDETLNAAYADAQALLAKESITPEELGAAMQNIITAAKAVAPEHLQNLRGYAVKYGAADAVDKVDAALAAIEAGNVAQMIATMTAVKEAATPLATAILTQMVGYAQNYAGFADDVTAAQAALNGGNYITMITTAKALYAKLMGAANDYVTSVKAIPTEGKNGVDELNAAILAAEQALAAQDSDFSAINTAISNLVAAVKAFNEANKPEPAEGIIYSWESPAGEVIEAGGTIAYVNGDGDRLNYKNGDYYTICLNGKKANLNDETASANAGHMVITLNKALEEGDVIAMTAYINKSESKKASAYIVFENGTSMEGEVYSDEANIDPAFGGVPTTKTMEVPAAAAGSKTVTLTRSQAGTNLFITKLEISEKSDLPTGIKNLTPALSKGEGVYNLNGQKVNKAQKGLFIINGKKVVIK